MKHLIKIAVAALILGTSASAMAEGMYGALDFGRTKAKDGCTALATVGVVGCKDTANAYRLAAGYQFHPMWGTEFSYANYGKASLGTAGGFPVGDWKMSGFQISGTGTFPVGSAFDVIGKLGIARTQLKTTGSASLNVPAASSSKTKLAYGIGAQFNVSQSVAIRAQYENLGKVGEGDITTCVACTGTYKVTLMTVGAVVKF